MALRTFAGVLLLLAGGCGTTTPGVRHTKTDLPPPAASRAEAASVPQFQSLPEGLRRTGISPALALQLGHAGTVTAVAFHPSKMLLATGAIDATVRAWDANTGAQIQMLAGHRSRVKSVAFSHDGTLLASASLDTTVTLWQVGSWRRVRTLRRKIPREDSQPLSFLGGQSVAFSPDDRLLACGYSDGQIILWETETGRQLRQWKGGDRVFDSMVAFSPDGQLMATIYRARRSDVIGTDRQLVKLWEVETGALVRTITPRTYYPLGEVLFSPNGTLLAAGDTIYDVATGGIVLPLGDGGIETAAFSPDGLLVACAVLQRPHDGVSARGRSDHYHLELWDLAKGEQVQALPGEVRVYSHVAFSADGELLAAGIDKQDVGLWEVATGRLIGTLAGRVSGVTRVAWDADGSSLAVLTKEGPPVICDLQEGTVELLLGESERQAKAIAFSRDGEYLALGVDNEIELRDANTRRLLRTLEGHTKSVISLAFSRDGRALASGSWDETARLWDVATGRLIHVLRGDRRDGRPSPSVWSPGSADWRADFALATPSFDHGVQFVRSGRIAPGVVDIAFSPGDDVLATAAVHYLALWDVATGRRLRMMGSGPGTYSLAFAPTGDLLAFGMYDGPIKLWRTDSWTQVRQSREHLSRVNQLAFDPAGRLLASCGNDPAVKLWDVRSGRLARAFNGHTWRVQSVAFHPSGHRLSSGSSDGTVRVWDTASGRNLLTLYLLDKGREWIALDSLGHYDCSEGAQSAVAWRVGDEVSASGELAAELRRPGLVAQVGANEPRSANLRR